MSDNPYASPVTATPENSDSKWQGSDEILSQDPGGLTRAGYIISHIVLMFLLFATVFSLLQVGNQMPFAVEMVLVTAVGFAVFHFYLVWKRLTNVQLNKAWMLLYFVGAGFVPLGMAFCLPKSFGVHRKMDMAGWILFGFFFVFCLIGFVIA